MPKTGIASGRMKLARALHHLEDLDRRITRYVAKRPVLTKVVLVKDGTPADRDIKFHVVIDQLVEVPNGWPLILGDVVTNLRAALDHAVFPIARQFPIVKVQPINQQTGVPSPIKSLPGHPAATAIIEAAQPYNDIVSADHHSLGILNELVNEDKHRNVLITSGCFLEPHIGIPEDVEVIEEPTTSLYGQEMYVGAVLAKFALRPTHAETRKDKVYYDPAPKVTIVLDVPKTPDNREAVPMLREIHAYISTLLDDLEAAGLP
ncbi:hypothetical protein [Nocardia rhizosphaerae]|uniref:Uncharacterized protein n=1 Tax=Nocardia rhizosphaerae TaxID=1691571 RepID=A0ABV8LEI0_9NOCA